MKKIFLILTLFFLFPSWAVAQWNRGSGTAALSEGSVDSTHFVIHGVPDDYLWKFDASDSTWGLETDAGGTPGPNSIDSSHVKNGSLIGVDLKADLIDSTKIAAGSVSETDLVQGSLDSTEIQDAGISGADIKANAIDSTKIPAGAISETDIVQGSLDSTELQDGGIIGTDIKAATIPSSKLDLSDVYTFTDSVAFYNASDSVLIENGRVTLEMDGDDTLATSQQDSIEYYANLAAKIYMKVLNSTGSNAGATVRKNWGAIHLDDGPSGTDNACLLSARTQGDSTFSMHLLVSGNHSSARKIAMEGVADPSERGVNIIMPLNGSQSSQTGVLVRDAGSIGSGIQIQKYADGYGLHIEAYDDDSSACPSTLPLFVENYNDSTTARFYAKEVDGTAAAKTVVEIIADTLSDDYVAAGLKISGSAFDAAGDSHLLLYDSAASKFWRMNINNTTKALRLFYGSDATAEVTIDSLGFVSGRQYGDNTFGSSMTADTVVVTGMTTSSRAFVQARGSPAGHWWAVTKTDTLIVNSTNSESSTAYSWEWRW